MLSKEQARQELQELIEFYMQTKERETLSESDVIQKFIERLFGKVLGWQIGDPETYTNEVYLKSGGRVDRLLKLPSGEPLYIEAKRFGAIKTLSEMQAERSVGHIIREANRRQTDLERAFGPDELNNSAMSPNRTREEQQAINYAFENNGTWAILTNFERFRLYNARRDWLVFSIEDVGGYLDKFDILWLLSRENLEKNSLETLKGLRYATDIDREYLDLINIWRRKLANSLVNYRQENTWMLDKNGTIQVHILRDVVQRLIDRLVIIRFAEDHLVIPPSSLYKIYELEKENYYTFSIDEFVQRFFRRFDETHNSALFSEDIADLARFHPDDTVLKDLIGQLYLVKYRAMPADILGNTYEQYLGKALTIVDDKEVSIRDNLETRKKQGSYYTPQVIVRYIVDNSLGRYLYGTDNGKADGTLLEGETRKNSREIMDLRVLDSACGSGSFLIYAYQVLRDFYESEIARLDLAYKEGVTLLASKFGNTTLAEEVAVKQHELERERLRNYPTIILEQHLYGVDLDPQAAEIAVVNLMMRAMEKQGAEKRLPLILNQNVKVGNGLIGLRPDDERLSDHAEALATIKTLRADLKATPNTDPAHDKIIADLETALTNLRKTLNAHYAEHFTDLEATRIFHWGVEFPEVFYDEQGKYRDNGGFQVIIGNPPWEIIKPDLREFYAQFDENIESRLSRAKAEARIKELNAEDPDLDTQWQAQVKRIEEQASFFRVTDDYTKQGRGDTATHKLFVERVYGLLGKKGRLGYVVPSGIYKDLGTKELREMVLETGSFEYIYGLSNVKKFFPGVNDRVQFAIFGTQKGMKNEGFWSTFRFNPRVGVAPDDFPEFVANKDNLIYVKSDSIERFSPDSLSMMEFKSQSDANIVGKMYDDIKLLGDDTAKWSVNLNREFDMTNDRHLFNTSSGVIAVYNGRMIHQFDSAFAPHEYWIAENKVVDIREARHEQINQYRLSFRRIARPTDTRTLISAVVAPNTICDTVALVNSDDKHTKNTTALYLAGTFNSLSLDYILRHKIASTVNFFYMYQLPLPRLTEGNPYFDALVQRSAMLTCTRPEFADLWVEVMGSAWQKPLKGASAEAVRPISNEAQRETVRHEIDALVAHLYGLSRAEFAHILSTFPLVFPNSNEGQAKQSALLAEYDTWQAKVEGWSRA